MGYGPFHGDNPDLDGLPDGTYERLIPLAERIELSHRLGLHRDLCACDTPYACAQFTRNTSTPSVEETVGWLLAQGWLPPALLDLHYPAPVLPGPAA